MIDTLSLVVLVVLIVLAFVAQRSLTLDAEHEAEHQRERATDALRACAGLRYDLTVARSNASEAAAAKRALRRRCRGALREARRWKREAVARGWTRERVS